MEVGNLDKKRERDNKISKLMGEYLLKGYKMLGSTCNACGTILLKDRQQKDYCVGCSEVDVHLVYNALQQNPSQDEPRTQTFTTLPQDTLNESFNDEDNSEKTRSHQTIETTANVHNTVPPTYLNNTCLTTINNAILKLQDRLMMAVDQLGKENSIETDIKLCELISSCGNALRTLKDLQH